ncbi:DUF4231 domain-containing protein [bacterium]|nr:DUF4231 domain-containing protein [bacterium]
MESCSRYPVEFENALSTIALTPLQQSILKGRYIPLIQHIQSRTSRISILFHSTRIIVTIGSLIVPALLSIQGASNTNAQIYWSTWTISLLVTICNALVTLFKFDKRYYYLHTILEKLISEGWQFVELTGKYSGYHIHGGVPTHNNQFIYFCHAIEKIRMKQVEEEYYKLTDGQQTTVPNQTGQDALKNTSLIPPTPQQGDLLNIPSEIVNAVKEQISPPPVEDARQGQAYTKESEKKSAGNTKNIENGSISSVSVSFDV